MSADPFWSHHPLHPAIVHLPIGCWALVLPLDLWAVATGIGAPGLEPAAVAHGLLWAGLAFAIAAMLSGALDYWRAPTRVRNHPLIDHHVGWMAASWCVWLLAGLLRIDAGQFGEPASFLVLTVEALALTGLTIGGAIAGRIVFVGR